MKRVKAACICQTLHFQLKDGIPGPEAGELVRQEVDRYKKELERNGTRYRILEETTQPDGSVVIRIIKQYNTVPVGNYLD